VSTCIPIIHACDTGSGRQTHNLGNNATKRSPGRIEVHDEGNLPVRQCNLQLLGGDLLRLQTRSRRLGMMRHKHALRNDASGACHSVMQERWLPRRLMTTAEMEAERSIMQRCTRCAMQGATRRVRGAMHMACAMAMRWKQRPAPLPARRQRAAAQCCCAVAGRTGR